MIQLSEIDCKQILRNSNEKETRKFMSFHVEVFGNYLGFLGEYYRLKIDVKNDESNDQLIFFAKSLPLENVERREMLLSSGIFNKEVEIYRNILPHINKYSKGFVWCPKAHFIRDDLIIFNDLSNEGYQMLPFRLKFDRKHVEMTLMTLARFHSCSIAYEVDGNSIEENFGRILFETSICDIPWFHSGLKVSE